MDGAKLAPDTEAHATRLHDGVGWRADRTEAGRQRPVERICSDNPGDSKSLLP